MLFDGEFRVPVEQNYVEVCWRCGPPKDGLMVALMYPLKEVLWRLYNDCVTEWYRY
jgi:hypothetical protein